VKALNHFDAGEGVMFGCNAWKLLSNSWPGFEIVLGVILIVFTTNVFAETWKRGTEQEEKRGAKLYVMHCQACHGSNGVGGQPVPPMLRNPDYFEPPALDDSQHAWHHSDENLVEMILEGSPRTPQMPAWKSVLSQQEAADLVAYMKSLWSDRALSCQGPKHMSCMH